MCIQQWISIFNNEVLEKQDIVHQKKKRKKQDTSNAKITLKWLAPSNIVITN